MKSYTTLFVLTLLFTSLFAGQATAQSADAQPTQTEAMLEDITAYLKINDNLSTSGQITYDQIASLKEAGFEVVVNLAPADESRNSLEGFLVTQEGMSYVQIPVSWRDPSERDLQMFFDVMETNKDRKVYVHCFANMRVSAFVYLYRTLHQDVSDEVARADLAKIWDPNSQAQWSSFIERMQEKHGS